MSAARVEHRSMVDLVWGYCEEGYLRAGMILVPAWPGQSLHHPNFAELKGMRGPRLIVHFVLKTRPLANVKKTHSSSQVRYFSTFYLVTEQR
jgi:hypothetical protein